MITRYDALAVGLFLASLVTGVGQPIITNQPQSQTNLVGATTTFMVGATGTEPLAYQWQADFGLGFTDQIYCTNATLVLTNVQASQAGDYRVVITDLAGTTASDAAHLYVIVPPTLQFASATYTVAEDAGSAALNVLRTGDLDPAVTVDFATADGTATNGLKYTATNGTLTFAAGETNKAIVVPILNEGFVEGTRSFTVTLSNPTNAILGTRVKTTVNILDTDVGIQFEFANYNAANGWAWGEDVGTVQLGVVRGDDANLSSTVVFGTSDGTAANGVDYLGFTNTLSFAPMERLKFVSVTILNDSLKERANKAFRPGRPRSPS